MANFRYFADLPTGTVELTKVWHDGHVSRKAVHFLGLTPDGVRVNATRVIERKSNPSNHQCDGRCLNARGFKCECSCKGRNHGAGSFMCEAA